MTVRPIAWGLVGPGDIARKRVAAALQSLGPRAGLHGIAGRKVEVAAAFARDFKIPRVYQDWRELVSDPEIDAVYVATPVDLHAPMTIAAARAGKHVLCEKPMALTYGECRAMVDACRRAGVRLGVAYYRRFYPAVRKMKRLIDERAIGEPVHAEFLVAEKFDAAGRAAPRRWLVEKKRSGGGPMMDLGSHRIDLLVYLLGDVRSARGELRNLRFKRRDVEDYASATLLFDGARGRRPLAVGTATHCFDHGQDRLAIYGTAGSLVSPSLQRGELHVHTVAGEKSYRLPPHRNLHLPLIRDFQRALAEGRDPLVTGEEGARASRVLDLIYGRS